MKKIPLLARKPQNKKRRPKSTLFTLVDDCDFEFLRKFRWYVTDGGYAAAYTKNIAIGGVTAFMHRVIAKTPKGFLTDHKNMKRLDNRRKNLRVCTKRQNLWNRGKTRISTTGFKGVTKHRKSFHARITVGGVTHCVGAFKTPIEAHKAYCRAAKRLHGEFARGK